MYNILVSLHAIYRHGAFDHYDTICAAGPHHVKEIRAIEKLYDLPERISLNLVTQLDNLIKIKSKNFNINNRRHMPKQILIAPSWGSGGIRIRAWQKSY